MGSNCSIENYGATTICSALAVSKTDHGPFWRDVPELATGSRNGSNVLRTPSFEPANGEGHAILGIGLRAEKSPQHKLEPVVAGTGFEPVTFGL